jgi:hypothetical protein
VAEGGGTLQGAGERSLVSGGLRYATTTGYYLTALQADWDGFGADDEFYVPTCWSTHKLPVEVFKYDFLSPSAHHVCPRTKRTSPAFKCFEGSVEIRRAQIPKSFLPDPV